MFSKDNFALFLYVDPNCHYGSAQVLFWSQIAEDFAVLKYKKSCDDC